MVYLTHISCLGESDTCILAKKRNSRITKIELFIYSFQGAIRKYNIGVTLATKCKKTYQQNIYLLFTLLARFKFTVYLRLGLSVVCV